MDMKKILQAFDGATTKKPVQGANDMKKFVSIVRESASPYTATQESVITSFEAGSVGGDANAFLLAADTIQDEVMAQVNKIKINADEANLRDMMEKFNAFMTAYHNVGKGILQPDMFNDSMGESTDEQVDEAGQYVKPGSSTAYDRDYASSVSGMGKKDSLAYQQDGGANDEGWDEPKGQYQAPQDKPKMTGMFFYNVQPGQEQEAAALGIKKTKSGKWAKTKYNTSGRTFGFQKDQADKAFGVGKWWAPKTESVEQGVAEGVPQPGPSSGAPKKFGPDAKIETGRMTVKQIISSIPGVPYYNNVVDDWDAKDYSWGVTKKVIEYATYLKDHPESLEKLPPAIVLNGKFEDGAHRVSAIWLLQQRMDPKNPLWKNAKLNVQFVKQGVAEAEKKGLYYYVNKRKAAGTSRPASSPKAPTAQAWKDAAKTAKKESLSFKDYVNLEEAKKGLE